MANDISKLKDLQGVIHDIKDAVARADIEALKGFASSGVSYAGVTTTALEDGATTSPVIVNEKEVNPLPGMEVSYNDVMFAWNGEQWDQLGSAGALKALAYKTEVEGEVTPAGTNTAPAFTGTPVEVNVSGTPTGTVAAPAFTGTAKDVSVKGTPAGDVTVSIGAPATDAEANYTPAGEVAITPTTETVKEVDSVGTLPQLTTTVEDETLVFTFDQGALPTTKDTDVLSGATASFTGKGTKIGASFAGEQMTSTGSYTPEGTNAAPEFTGNELKSTGSVTAAGTVDAPVFTGEKATVTSK